MGNSMLNEQRSKGGGYETCQSGQRTKTLEEIPKTLPLPLHANSHIEIGDYYGWRPRKAEEHHRRAEKKQAKRLKQYNGTHPLQTPNSSNMPDGTYSREGTPPASKRARTNDGGDSGHYSSSPPPHASEEREDGTIDDLDSRKKKPLPRRNMAPVYSYPNPEEETADTSHIPHLQLSQQGEKPDMPPANPDPYTDEKFQRIIIPIESLLYNMDPIQRKSIEENLTENVAIIPWGAHYNIFLDKPLLNQHVKIFLTGLGFANSAELDVVKPVPRNRPDKKKLFAKPWPMILTKAPPALRTYLLWHQTFSVNAQLNFSVIPFDKEIKSWVVMVISGDAVKPGDEQKRKVIGVLRKVLWHVHAFRKSSERCYALEGVPGSTSDRVVDATRSFHLEFIDTCDKDGNNSPVYVLTAKPPTTDRVLHEEWIEVITKQKYFVDLVQLEINKRLIDCGYCKSVIHPAHDCSFPKVDDWNGIIPDNKERFQARLQAEKSKSEKEKSQRGKGKEKGKFPAKKSEWTTVSRKRKV